MLEVLFFRANNTVLPSYFLYDVKIAMKNILFCLCILFLICSTSAALDMNMDENVSAMASFLPQSLLQQPLLVLACSSLFAYGLYFHFLQVILPVVYTLTLSAELLHRLFSGRFDMGLNQGVFQSPIQAALNQKHPMTEAWEKTQLYMKFIENYLVSGNTSFYSKDGSPPSDFLREKDL